MLLKPSPLASRCNWWRRNCSRNPTQKPPQEAQLSQRGRAMLYVIEYLAKPLKIGQGHLKWHHSIDLIRVHWLFIVTMALSSIISEMKRDYMVKIAVFFIHPALGAENVRGPRRDIAIRFGMVNWNGVATQCWRIWFLFWYNTRTRQTDTARRHRPRLCIASRGQNWKLASFTVVNSDEQRELSELNAV